MHWVLFNLPPGTRGLPENVPVGKTLANGAKHGAGSSKKNGYLGPCPPSSVHGYYSSRCMLSIQNFNIESGITKEKLLKAMGGHVLAEGQLMGTYKRQ